MTDAYEPRLDTLVLSAEETAAIEAALATETPWDWKPGGEVENAIKSAKNKIRDHHLERHGGKCCYCRTRLKGGGSFMVDREHILPKSKPAYKPHSYKPWNLAASCKRCNMQYKKSRDDFVADKTDAAAFETSGNYAFIHPNFDLYSHHLKHRAIEIDEYILVKFAVVEGSGKGAYTYDYFNLRELEENRFDQAQGVATPTEPETDLMALARELARRMVG